MISDIVQASFDYGMLDTETRIVVQQRTGEIKTLVRKSAQDIIDIGAKLLEVKARLGHGQFAGWLRSEFEWSQDTAGRFMQVTQRFGQIPQIAEFAPSALYLLASPSTPDEAVDEALTRAAAGETISHATAQEIVQEHKPAQPQYAEVWRLQHVVQDVFEHFYKHEDRAYACRDMRAAAKARAGGFWERCERSMPADIKDYRKSDLAQAINNLAAQKEAQANGTNYPAGDPHSHKVQPATAPTYMKFVCLSCGCIYDRGSCDECHSFTYQVATSPEEAERLSAAVKAAKAVARAERQAAEPMPVAEVIDAELFEAAERASITNCKAGEMRKPFQWNGAYWVSTGGVYGGIDVEFSHRECVRVHPGMDEPIAPGVRIGCYRDSAYLPGTELRHGANVWRIGEQWLVVKRRRGDSVIQAAQAAIDAGQATFDAALDAKRKETATLPPLTRAHENDVYAILEHMAPTCDVASADPQWRIDYVVSALLRDDKEMRQELIGDCIADWMRQQELRRGTDKVDETVADESAPEASLAGQRWRRLHTLRVRFNEVIDLLPEFGDLTGRHTATLMAQRELVHMIEILDSELDALQRFEVSA